MYKKSLMALGIGIITPLFSWMLLKSLANNSSSAHNPDPWIQSLIDQPRNFEKNNPVNGWFKIVSKDLELFWEKSEAERLPVSDIPSFSGNVIFVVDARGPKAAYSMHEFLKERTALKTALILSASDGFLKDMQFYNGQLLLSCGQAYLIRLRMLGQLGLANLMKTNMSAAWIDGEVFAKDIPELSSELLQRRVPVFLGPQTSKDFAPTGKINILNP